MYIITSRHPKRSSLYGSIGINYKEDHHDVAIRTGKDRKKNIAQKGWMQKPKKNSSQDLADGWMKDYTNDQI